MSAKVKKFFKWFIIILLVVGSVVATVFIFFKNYNEKQIKEVNLVSVLNAKEKEKFDHGLNSVLTILDSHGKEEWFADVKMVSDNLDESLYVLTSYYADNNGKVKDKEVSITYSSMITTRNTLIDMFEEYCKKSTSIWFPAVVGANDIYSAVSNYLVKYAKLIKAVNDNLIKSENFDSTSDIKFSLIDLYSRITVDAFDKLTIKNDLQIIENDSNVDEINKSFKFNNFYIDNENAFSLSALKFIQNYNECNKELFAENFVENLVLATGFDEKASKEIKTAFYFNEIF